jgi:hypothetical protein
VTQGLDQQADVHSSFKTAFDAADSGDTVSLLENLISELISQLLVC